MRKNNNILNSYIQKQQRKQKLLKPKVRYLAKMFAFCLSYSLWCLCCSTGIITINILLKRFKLHRLIYFKLFILQYKNNSSKTDKTAICLIAQWYHKSF